MPAPDWDDLRYVLAVANAGSLARAAHALGVDHTTVLRRLRALEKRLDARLFDRRSRGYTLTAGGEELVAAAKRIDETVAALERRLAGEDLRLAGTIRVATTDTLMATVLPEILAAFHAAHPGITVEIALSNAMANLTRRDADVAIRPAREAPENLVGRRLSTLAFAIYASPGYFVAHDTRDLTHHDWVAPDDSLGATSVAAWMRARIPDDRIVLRADSLLALRHAAEAGLGLAALPCYLADRSSALVRVQRPIPEMATALWLLTHADLRRTARIRAFLDIAAATLRRRRPLLEGEAPRPRRR